MKNKFLNFRIDKLTSSIENRVSGEIKATETILVSKSELIRFNKKNNWFFNWKNLLKDYPDCSIYKLTLADYKDETQGLIAFENRTNFLFIILIENAPSNRKPNKKYLGVLGNLVAFICKLSFEKGFDGIVAFDAKTKLIDHYKTALKAVHIGRGRMMINSRESKELVDKYFSKNE
jgi:hypothetical protein